MKQKRTSDNIPRHIRRLGHPCPPVVCGRSTKVCIGVSVEPHLEHLFMDGTYLVGVHLVERANSEMGQWQRRAMEMRTSAAIGWRKSGTKSAHTFTSGNMLHLYRDRCKWGRVPCR